MNKHIAKFGMVAIAGMFATPALADSLTIVSWGGAYTASQQSAYHDPWTKKTGTTIINEDKSQAGLAGLRAQVEAGNVTWDLVDMLPSEAQIACDEGLVEMINPATHLAAAPDGTSAAKDFISGALGECFVASIVYSNIEIGRAHV